MTETQIDWLFFGIGSVFLIGAYIYANYEQHRKRKWEQEDYINELKNKLKQ